MSIVLLVCSVGLLALPRIAGRVGRRLPPHRWARITAACLVAGLILWETGLALLAAPALLRSSHAGGLADACLRLLGRFEPVASPTVGWLAVALAGWTAAGIVRAHRRIGAHRRVAHLESWVGEHELRDGYDLVILPVDDMVAMSVPGTPAQVVVSTAMVKALTDDQFAAVLRHEEAHLTHHHDRLLNLAGVAGARVALVPFARTSARVLETAVERWADEAAAGENCEDRRALRTALWEVTATRALGGIAAFAGPCTVVERLRALDRPAPEPSVAATVLVGLPVGSLLILAALTLFAARSELGLLVSLARACAG